MRSVGQGAPRQRLGLVVRAVGGGSAREETLGLIVLLRDVGCVVVLNLVIVPGQEPRARRVRCLQQGITLVEGVACPIVIERMALGRPVVADATLTAGHLIDVVAS